MHPYWVEIIGMLAAITTTLCWAPQALKMLKDKRTEGVSLTANAAFAFGQVLWLIYGLSIGALPIILANVVTLALVLAIIGLKLRYG